MPESGMVFLCPITAFQMSERFQSHKEIRQIKGLQLAK